MSTFGPGHGTASRTSRTVIESCANRRDRAIVALMLDAGLRQEEIANLRLGDVNLVVGKGRKVRIVPIPVAARYVRQWLQVRPPCETDTLFVTLGRE